MTAAGEVEDLRDQIGGFAARSVDRGDVRADPDVGSVGTTPADAAFEGVPLPQPQLLDHVTEGGNVGRVDELLEATTDQILATAREEIAEHGIGVEQLAVDRPDRDGDRRGIEHGRDPLNMARVTRADLVGRLGEGHATGARWLVGHPRSLAPFLPNACGGTPTSPQAPPRPVTRAASLHGPHSG